MDARTRDVHTLSLHDALPICQSPPAHASTRCSRNCRSMELQFLEQRVRSEEHTSELQSRQYLVCRLLLQKKKIPPPRGTSRLCRTRGERTAPAAPPWRYHLPR